MVCSCLFPLSCISNITVSQINSSYSSPFPLSTLQTAIYINRHITTTISPFPISLPPVCIGIGAESLYACIDALLHRRLAGDPNQKAFGLIWTCSQFAALIAFFAFPPLLHSFAQSTSSSSSPSPSYLSISSLHSSLLQLFFILSITALVAFVCLALHVMTRSRDSLALSPIEESTTDLDTSSSLSSSSSLASISSLPTPSLALHGIDSTTILRAHELQGRLSCCDRLLSTRLMSWLAVEDYHTSLAKTLHALTITPHAFPSPIPSPGTQETHGLSESTSYDMTVSRPSNEPSLSSLTPYQFSPHHPPTPHHNHPDHYPSHSTVSSPPAKIRGGSTPYRRYDPLTAVSSVYKHGARGTPTPIKHPYTSSHHHYHNLMNRSLHKPTGGNNDHSADQTIPPENPQLPLLQSQSPRRHPHLDSGDNVGGLSANGPTDQRLNAALLGVSKDLLSPPADLQGRETEGRGAGDMKKESALLPSGLAEGKGYRGIPRQRSSQGIDAMRKQDTTLPGPSSPFEVYVDYSSAKEKVGATKDVGIFGDRSVNEGTRLLYPSSHPSTSSPSQSTGSLSPPPDCPECTTLDDAAVLSVRVPRLQLLTLLLTVGLIVPLQDLVPVIALQAFGVTFIGTLSPPNIHVPHCPSHANLPSTTAPSLNVEFLSHFVFSPLNYFLPISLLPSQVYSLSPLSPSYPL